MRRTHSNIKFVVVYVMVLGLAVGVVGALQTGNVKALTVKEVKVNAKTLAKNSKLERYEVDLVTGGTIYEFDPTAGQIDFQRIVIQTGDRDQDISSWLKKNFPDEFSYQPDSDILSVGRTADFKNFWDLQPLGTGTSVGFTCNQNYCDCSGKQDCRDILHTNVCQGDFFACTYRGGGEVRCICSRQA